MGFGDLQSICQQAPLPLCEFVGTSPITGASGTPPICYARTIELANTTIFQGAASFVHILALIMTVIMIIHVRGKFTAVGRKEITTFFYTYMAFTVISLILDAGVVPPSSSFLPVAVAAQVALASAMTMSLLINGFVGFQLYEDGTTLSVWLLRGFSFAWFFITGLIALLTFEGLAGLGSQQTLPLFIVMYIINGVFLVVYVAMQLFLVLNTLQDRWPLGDIVFGILFFVVGQVILYALSAAICENVQHYLDGLFFVTITDLLAVMMVYKYWDSITKEDLEFSVAVKTGSWDVKEFVPVPQEEMYEDLPLRNSHFHGARATEYSSSSLLSPPPRGIR